MKASDFEYEPTAPYDEQLYYRPSDFYLQRTGEIHGSLQRTENGVEHIILNEFSHPWVGTVFVHLETGRIYAPIMSFREI